MTRFVVSAYENGELVQRRWPADNMIMRTVCQLSAHGRSVIVQDRSDDAAQDAVEGRTKHQPKGKSRYGNQ